MKGFLRLLAVSSAALGALALAGSAAAAYNSPRLTILNPDEKTSGGGRVTIEFEAAIEDDATYRLAIHVPVGYTTSLVPQAGQRLGTVVGEVNATAIAPGARVPVTGNIVGDTFDPAKYPNGAGCVGEPTIDGVWRLELSAAGTPLVVPMYVQAIEGPPLGDVASGRLVACLPSPYAEAGPARAAFGAKLLNATLNVRGVFTNPTTRGAYLWRALATPWTVNSGTPNPAATVEIQGFDTIPANLSMAAAVNHRLNRVTLTGRLTENAAGVPGRIVEILRGARVLKRARTTRTGSFRAVVRLRPGRYTIRAQAKKAGFNLGPTGCTATPAFGGVPCVSATSSSFSVFVNRRVVVRVR